MANGKEALESALFWLPWIKTAKFWAGVLVGIGIAGEIIGDRLAAPYEKIIDDARESQIAQLGKEAAEARLALETYKAPRTLSPEQQRRIALKLSAFEGTTFELITYRAEPEPASLAESIAAAVKNAKWSLIPVDGSMLGVASGVFVTVNKTTCDESGRCTEGVLKSDQDAAEALVTALRDEGIVSALTTPGNLRINPRVAVQIHVGLKPR